MEFFPHDKISIQIHTMPSVQPTALMQKTRVTECIHPPLEHCDRKMADISHSSLVCEFLRNPFRNRKWQDYVYIQCEYKSTKQKIKHLLREENKVKENKIS